MFIYNNALGGVTFGPWQALDTSVDAHPRNNDVISISPPDGPNALTTGLDKLTGQLTIGGVVLHGYADYEWDALAHQLWRDSQILGFGFQNGPRRYLIAWRRIDDLTSIIARRKRIYRPSIFAEPVPLP